MSNESDPHRSRAEMPERCPVCGSAAPHQPAESLANEDTEAPCPTCGHLLWFVSRRVGDVTVIHLVDHRVAVLELLDLLDNAVDEGLHDRLLIHFGSIQQVSSAALGKLVKLMNRAGRFQGRMKLCGLHADLRQVFKITRLDRIFETHDTEREALVAFGVA